MTSLSRALGLSEDERLHLARLAGHAPTAFDGPDGEVSDGVRLLLGRLGRVPAYVLNARYDVVAWNDAAAELFPDLPLLPPGRRNAMRMWMDPGETACGPLSEGEREPLRQVAADLRRAAAHYPSDPELHQLIDDLMGQSPAFTAAWANHDVRALPTLRKRIEHPELGVFELDCQTLWIPGHDQRVVFYTAPPGSPDQAKLSRLGVGSLDKI